MFQMAFELACEIWTDLPWISQALRKHLRCLSRSLDSTQVYPLKPTTRHVSEDRLYRLALNRISHC